MKSTFTADELNQLKDRLIEKVVKTKEHIETIDDGDIRNLAYFDGKETAFEQVIDMITRMMNE